MECALERLPVVGVGLDHAQVFAAVTQGGEDGLAVTRLGLEQRGVVAAGGEHRHLAGAEREAAEHQVQPTASALHTRPGSPAPAGHGRSPAAAEGTAGRRRCRRRAPYSASGVFTRWPSSGHARIPEGQRA